MRTSVNLTTLTALSSLCPGFGQSPIPEAKLPGKSAPIAIGSHRELFVDDHIIAQLNGGQFKVHKPEPEDVVLVCDAPWEGNLSLFHTIFEDDGLFRMYYRGAHYATAGTARTLVQQVCYAESLDGISWRKPNLGLVEFQGSKANNIIWSGVGSHNFTPFKDENPDCPPDARYKAISAGSGEGLPRGLKVHKSHDGIHWSRVSHEPIITDGDFDSQNLAFWDSERNCYFAYHRKKNFGSPLLASPESWVRDIMVSTSSDFVRWTEPIYLRYADNRREHLYTNCIQPYFRSPRLFVGFPTRYQPRTNEVEPILMTSRDGLHFNRWDEALIPTTAPQDRAGNRSNFMAWGLVQTPGSNSKLSVYANEAYFSGPGSRVRRFTFRTDGFVSIHAGPRSAEVVTKPLTFTGSTLLLNAETSASGSVLVELLDDAGRPLPGFELENCVPVSGDSIDHRVRWQRSGDLGPFAGKPLRLRFILESADLYAIRFSV